MTPAVTVRGLLDARPESVGLSIEVLAGAAGLTRCARRGAGYDKTPGCAGVSRWT